MLRVSWYDDQTPTVPPVAWNTSPVTPAAASVHNQATIGATYSAGGVSR